VELLVIVGVGLEDRIRVGGGAGVAVSAAIDTDRVAGSGVSLSMDTGASTRSSKIPPSAIPSTPTSRVAQAARKRHRIRQGERLKNSRKTDVA
jgi:hypothetical protein